jgi:hypothetical protein
MLARLIAQLAEVDLQGFDRARTQRGQPRTRDALVETGGRARGGSLRVDDG